MARIVQSRVDPAKSTTAEEPDARPVSDEPAVSEQGMPHGADIRGVFQGGLFMLALLAALYAGREIVLPIVLAIILNLLLMLERLHVPKNARCPSPDRSFVWQHCRVCDWNVRTSRLLGSKVARGRAASAGASEFSAGADRSSSPISAACAGLCQR
jgi:hypothetical protein